MPKNVNNDELDLNAIGLRLREFRRSKGYTQKELAEILDVGRTVVANIEQGLNGPGLRFLIRIFERLNLSIYWLLTGIKEESKLPENKKEKFDLLKFYLERNPEYFDHVYTEFIARWKPAIDEELYEKG